MSLAVVGWQLKVDAVARTIKLTLQYDGTDYVGWQRQANGTSIQGRLEEALRPIEGASVNVFGAGRTDAGVHALGQVASIRLSASIDPTALGRALNAVLPADIRVVEVEDVPHDFHARFSAVGKIYQYRIINAATVSPFVRRFAWHVPQKLNLDPMREASALVRGAHDFAAFQGRGVSPASTERTIHRIEWREGAGNDVPFVMEIEGNGFLRHMVRSLAGTIVEIGLGRWPPAHMAKILASRSRAHAGRTAPAAGLFLVRVLY